MQKCFKHLFLWLIFILIICFSAKCQTNNKDSIQKVEILSDAYLYYPDFFDIEYNMDTLTFEERYQNFDYARTNKIDWETIKKEKNIEPQIKLNLLTTNDNKIWLSLKYSKEHFPELEVYDGMCWIYNSIIDKKDFKNKYIKNKVYTDIRLFYDEENNVFTIELKTPDGFIELSAIANFLGGNLDPKVAKEACSLRYPDYKIRLENEAEDLNYSIKKNKSRSARMYQREIDKAWRNLRRKMSEEENKMSNEEWLNYYKKLMHYLEQKDNLKKRRK